ncbi:hypothetical protein LJC37_02545, partial [Bacteroidales bacterium OttesenSCG-928-E04]|nr:hypothetical protein [Bacteroidales bacterium OttesenSCG-928-E04]
MKDIFHIQLYLGVILIPFICYLSDLPAKYYFLSILTYYALVILVDFIFFHKKRKHENRILGKLYFSEYGIHVKWPEQEDIITYDYEDVLQISIKYYASKGASPFNPFSVFSQSAALNTISFTHNNNFYYFHFISYDPKDYDKFFHLTRKIIPENVNTKLYSRSNLAVNRVSGQLLCTP